MLQFILVFGVWGYHGTTFYVAVLPNLVICRFVPFFFKKHEMDESNGVRNAKNQ